MRSLTPPEVAHDRAEVHETLEATRRVLSEQRDVDKDGLLGRMRELVQQARRLALCVCVCLSRVGLCLSVALWLYGLLCVSQTLTVWAGAAP